MSKELKTLRKQRGILKAQLTRFVTFLDDLKTDMSKFPEYLTAEIQVEIQYSIPWFDWFSSAVEGRKTIHPNFGPPAESSMCIQDKIRQYELLVFVLVMEW
ncbi:hypothetical protein JTB14_024434 [Gonioctena quinquepunctata]|nr:hypothetical protein JTB14_024434 [Gonioctena quinquepunctata]